MKPVNDFLDACKNAVKRVMHSVARVLNKVTRGKLSPNTVTLIGLLAHIPIAWLIAKGHPIQGAVLLIIFGLFDALDGELARLQKRENPIGMLLDSTTDRMKEIILYIGITFILVENMLLIEDAAYIAAVVVAACGGSVLVSYVNAWGEAVLSANSKKRDINQTFRGGLMRFEVRMFLIIVGLLTGWLLTDVSVIAVLVWVTAFGRLINVIRKLQDVQS